MTDTKPAAGDNADGNVRHAASLSSDSSLDSSSPPVGEVYDFLVERLPLDPKHWRELRTKRRFERRTVEELRFCSVGDQAASACQELRARYSPEAPVESRLFDRVVVDAEDTG